MVKEDLLDQSCGVIVVTFGGEEGAKKWMSDTGCTYPLVIDSNRDIYKLLGLGNTSVEKSNNTSGYSFYGAALARGESPPHHFEDDDYRQMGGDFVVSRNSIGGQQQQARLTYIHRSETATDRPTIPFLLRHVSSLKC